MSTNNSPELLSCPFCGSSGLIYRYYTGRCHVECVNLECHVYGPKAGNEEEAIKAWNTRHKGDDK